MRKVVLTLFILIVFLSIGLLTPNTVSADALGSANCGANDIDTAIGCVPVLNPDNGTAFAGFVLKWALGVGGGLAFLLIVYASFMVMTSQGNPERLKAGQELLTSAISGLLLLIFSIFILDLIGIKIFKLDLAWNFGK